MRAIWASPPTYQTRLLLRKTNARWLALSGSVPMAVDMLSSMVLDPARSATYYPQTRWLCSPGMHFHIPFINQLTRHAGLEKSSSTGLMRLYPWRLSWNLYHCTGLLRLSPGLSTTIGRYVDSTSAYNLVIILTLTQNVPPPKLRQAEDPRWYIRKPFGFSYYPKELVPTPRAWVETTGNLVFWQAHEKVCLPSLAGGIWRHLLTRHREDILQRWKDHRTSLMI